MKRLFLGIVETVVSFIVIVAIAAVIYTGCGAIKPIIRNIVDIAEIAGLLCENTMSEQPVSKLKGKTVQAFCKEKANLQPFIDEVKGSKLAASRKLGLVR